MKADVESAARPPAPPQAAPARPRRSSRESALRAEAGAARSAVHTAGMVAVLIVGGAFGGSTSRLGAQELPPGPGRDVVTARCVSCHESDLIAQQRLTRAAWGRSVDKMVRWGAVVESGERDPMLDYLAAHFAPKPAAANIVATAGSEAIYKRACLSCHENDLIESQRLTRAGWVRSVDKMIRWGAAVPPADRDPLVDYLAARYPPR